MFIELRLPDQNGFNEYSLASFIALGNYLCSKHLLKYSLKNSAIHAPAILQNLIGILSGPAASWTFDFELLDKLLLVQLVEKNRNAYLMIFCE